MSKGDLEMAIDPKHERMLYYGCIKEMLLLMRNQQLYLQTRTP